MKIHPWPLGIIVFFTAVIGFNTCFAILAASGYQGILDEHPYVKGLAYDAELRELENFARSGWYVSLHVDPASIHIEDSAGAPISGAQVVLYALRPDASRLDQELHFIEKDPGNYHVPGGLKHGKWILDLSIQKERMSYRSHNTIFVARPGEIVRLANPGSKDDE